MAQVYPQIPQASELVVLRPSINILDLPQNAELILQAILANETKVKLAKIHLLNIDH